MAAEGGPQAAETEYGIFLPIGNGGWIVSETAPHPEATYEYNKKAAVLADAYGLDFVMSMGKWRGYDGATDHWGRTLESITMMSGLAEATEHVKVWATVHTNLFHPALAAKMYTTLQDISGGRAGMNIVVGSYVDEFAQMGLWREDIGHGDRYRYTEEWTSVLKRLWTEDSVTHDGEFFKLDDCRSRPHPTPAPTLISAGRSDTGLNFQARNCDGSFLTAEDLPGLRDASRDVKERAQKEGRSIKTYSMLTVVMDDTDAAAEERRLEYGRGADIDALVNMKRSWGLPLDKALSLTSERPEDEAFQTPFVTGSPETVAGRIREIVEYAELDGLMLIFPDYHADLAAFGEKVMPLLRPAGGTAAEQG
ncbi:LLM class flavin-dependent oxidoreductase [Nocardiopsis sp. HUAS JQ3]|uniref:LLM class flavin-dependent oxidoreductase n=1 Tax=Nocardiopsis sp. HUAS JQ3 TaxID=3061629 RepID=UPI0023A9F472|nr:LLM class flavin-dependent oxidoreductase [Nocardiopsis sp. HUAS JQ3]WDZ90630.1 LLM class flavin-dependent oxidoreductase [Nocardiopsis sp. HUAS JQ3]